LPLPQASATKRFPVARGADTRVCGVETRLDASWSDAVVSSRFR
jgi:hypothetical protein